MFRHTHLRDGCIYSAVGGSYLDRIRSQDVTMSLAEMLGAAAREVADFSDCVDLDSRLK